MHTPSSKRNTARVVAVTSAVSVLAPLMTAGLAVAQPTGTNDTGVDTNATFVVDTARDGFIGGKDANGNLTGWSLIGDACLTPGMKGNGVQCASLNGWNGDPALNDGWLQLTDTTRGGTDHTMHDTEGKDGVNVGNVSNANKAGSALFNTNIPADRGLDITFTQVQGGGNTLRVKKDGNGFLDPTRGADGIGFFLVDGTKTEQLTQAGNYGHGLGYAQGGVDTNSSNPGAQTVTLPEGLVERPDFLHPGDAAQFQGEKLLNPGVDNGVIGLGLDAFGNFASKKFGSGINSTVAEHGSDYAGYSVEKTALTSADDGKACVRDPRAGKNPGIDPALLSDPMAALGKILEGDCNVFGLMNVIQKGQLFNEWVYANPADDIPHRYKASLWEPRADALTLRGPGNGVSGYPLLATKGYGTQEKSNGDIATSFGLKSFRSTLPANAQLDDLRELATEFENIANGGGGLNVGNIIGMAPRLLNMGTALQNLNSRSFDAQPSGTYYKYVRVTIEPRKDADSPVRVTAAVAGDADVTGTDASGQPIINWRTTDAAGVPFLSTTIPGSAVPDFYKFGFSASTGAGTDVHAIKDVRIKALMGGLEMTKSLDDSNPDAPLKDAYTVGDKVPYKFTVTNSGEAKLSEVYVDDPVLEGGRSERCDATELAPGESTNCYGVLTLTDAHLNTAKDKAPVTKDANAPEKPHSGYMEDGKFVNVAFAHGRNLDNDAVNDGHVYSNTDDERIPASPGEEDQVPTPKLDLVKDIDTDNAEVPAKETYAAGDKIPYKFTVENSGNVDLKNIKINDNALDAPATCAATDLAVGASTTCTGVHTLTEAEAAATEFKNIATATGDTPDGTPVESPPDEEIVPTEPPADPQPGLTLVKEVDADSELAKETYAAGDKVPYKFTVTNSGAVHMTDIGIKDDKLDEPATCDASELAVGESTNCYGVHTLTEAEAAQPTFTNIATATGVDPDGDPFESNPDDETVPTAPKKELTLVKDIDTDSELAKEVYAAGDKIPYKFTVTNNGAVDLTEVAIVDPALDENATCEASELAVGESTTCTGVHTLTAEEAAVGEFRNVAHSTAKDPEGNPVTSNEDDVVVPTAPEKGLSLTKDIDTNSELARDAYAPGEKIPYVFSVTNTGDVEVRDVVIVDGALDEDATCDATTLAVGESTNCYGVHTLTEAEAAVGEFLNVAYASGIDPEGNPVNSNEDQAVAPTKVPSPLAETGASIIGLALAGLLALAGGAFFALRRRA